jgi:hypothetical protein
MAVQRNGILARWGVLIGLLVVVLKSAYDLITYPEVVTSAGADALVYLLLLVLALLIYGWFALFRTRGAAPHARIVMQQGTRWGLFGGGVWILEVLVANVIGPQLGPFTVPAYFATTWIGYLLPGLAAVLSARLTGKVGAGLQAGVLAGMLSSLLLFLAVAFPLYPLLAGSNQPDAQTIHEFHRSGLPSLHVFLVSDWLAAMIAHLWIGLVTGMFFGGVGSAIGKALAAPVQAAVEEPVLTHETAENTSSASSLNSEKRVL